jgi:hypothetical protein
MSAFAKACEYPLVANGFEHLKNHRNALVIAVANPSNANCRRVASSAFGWPQVKYDHFPSKAAADSTVRDALPLAPDSSIATRKMPSILRSPVIP